MTKLGRARGLIRYSSQSAIEGEPRRLVRPRVIIYPVILCVLVTAFLVVLSTKGAADITVLRGQGRPFTLLDSGEIANPVRIKIRNRSSAERSYTVEASGFPGAHVVLEEQPPSLKPGAVVTVPASLVAPPGAFAQGSRDIDVRVSDTAGYSKTVKYRLMGPGTAAHPPQEAVK